MDLGQRVAVLLCVSGVVKDRCTSLLEGLPSDCKPYTIIPKPNVA